jgi:hypothetical protein
MKYWSVCIKCPRSIVSLEAVVCHHCETGSPPATPVDQMGMWNVIRTGGAPMSTVVFQYKGRDITYADFQSVQVNESGVHGIRLKSGESLRLDGGFLITED